MVGVSGGEVVGFLELGEFFLEEEEVGREVGGEHQVEAKFQLEIFEQLVEMSFEATDVGLVVNGEIG